MSAHQLITGVTWAVFVVLFVSTGFEAIRRPSRAHTEIALLFAAPALVVLVAVALRLGLPLSDGFSGALLSTGQLLVPYLTLRVARAFATVSPLVMRSAFFGLLFLVVASFVFQGGRPAWLFPLQLAYWVGLLLYGAFAFAAASRQASGITRRRLRSAAAGAILLGLAPLLAIMRPMHEAWLTSYELALLAAGGCFFFGFAPPARLRRSWQEPELRAFLRSSASLVHQGDETSALRGLERGTADALGAPEVYIGLWNEGRGALSFARDGDEPLLPAGANELGRRAFLDQRSQRSSGFGRPLGIAAMQSEALAGVTMATPLTAGPRRFGVLIVHTPREALFARDDLEVVELLAAQTAGVLESRALTADLAREQARAEAARLKEDFLSAAAHDLKTPLTTLIAQAQLLARRRERRPNDPPDQRTVELILQSAERLRILVSTLLDAARADGGRLVGELTSFDLGELVARVAAPYNSELHPTTVSIDGALPCYADEGRIAQLVGLLLDNAVKYSPAGGPIAVALRRQEGEALIVVSDSGIGIAPADLPYLFERFYRGSNVDDRSFAGMGLSLAIGRAIAEQHGGRMSVESKLGAGSVFTVALPLALERGEQ